MQHLGLGVPAFSESTFVGATVPIASLCNTPVCQSPPAPEPAEFEDSIVSSPNSDPDIPGSNSSLVNFTDHHSVFETSPKALSEVEMLEDDFGPIDIEGQADMGPTWMSNGMATTPAESNASETFCFHADAGANSHVNESSFPVDYWDIFAANMGFPPASAVLQQCQPSQSLLGAGILVPHVI